eukprot:7267286-Lingulodinium_polyedra.AAC.1
MISAAVTVLPMGRSWSLYCTQGVLEVAPVRSGFVEGPCSRRGSRPRDQRGLRSTRRARGQLPLHRWGCNRR